MLNGPGLAEMRTRRFTAPGLLEMQTKAQRTWVVGNANRPNTTLRCLETGRIPGVDRNTNRLCMMEWLDFCKKFCPQTISATACQGISQSMATSVKLLPHRRMIMEGRRAVAILPFCWASDSLVFTAVKLTLEGCNTVDMGLCQRPKTFAPAAFTTLAPLEGSSGRTQQCYDILDPIFKPLQPRLSPASFLGLEDVPLKLLLEILVLLTFGLAPQAGITIGVTL
ncbi:hypothetical protein B0H16DRAFT_1473709 [Mycena metata]|uniref:Uncharacterized protein n=1 Tax=Mycena metata TaxID=1033252 RepID=A0AAD7HIS9_9AGAR|nr:hypothetical protein B0H16DRAFT_1473709 [Mycena metata]